MLFYLRFNLDFAIVQCWQLVYFIFNYEYSTQRKSMTTTQPSATKRARYSPTLSSGRPSRGEGPGRFFGDPTCSFCGECGAVLPLPDIFRGSVICVVCKTAWPAKGFYLWLSLLSGLSIFFCIEIRGKVISLKEIVYWQPANKGEDAGGTLLQAT